jgi:hypothetical protein
MAETTEVLAAQTQAPASEGEKTLTQSQVNEIVKREKANTAERVRREMEALREQEASRAPQNGLDPAALEEKIIQRLVEMDKKAQEEDRKREQEAQDAERRQQVEKVASEFWLKMKSGKDQYSDFDEVMTDFDASAFPQLAFLSAGMENTAGIMYELSKNPTKLAQLNLLAERSPKLAEREMKKLSESISKNEEAKAENVSPNAPLSRLKSSNVGADTGKMSLKDYKNADWLKG